LAFNPDQSGIYAAGSYSKTIGLYSENDNRLHFLLEGHIGGVTQVLFPFFLKKKTFLFEEKKNLCFCR